MTKCFFRRTSFPLCQIFITFLKMFKIMPTFPQLDSKAQVPSFNLIFSLLNGYMSFRTFKFIYLFAIYLLSFSYWLKCIRSGFMCRVLYNGSSGNLSYNIIMRLRYKAVCMLCTLVGYNLLPQLFARYQGYFCPFTSPETFNKTPALTSLYKQLYCIVHLCVLHLDLGFNYWIGTVLFCVTHTEP